MHVCTAYDTMRVPVEGETDLCVLCASIEGREIARYLHTLTCACTGC